MTQLWVPGTPYGGEESGHDEYTTWDAAYVLGSLSSAERREFEAHMTGCPLVRQRRQRAQRHAGPPVAAESQRFGDGRRPHWR